MTKEYLPHQQRVIEEASELGEKIVKLTSFIHGNVAFNSVEKFEQIRLMRQKEVMCQYWNILKERIDNF